MQVSLLFLCVDALQGGILSKIMQYRCVFVKKSVIL